MLVSTRPLFINEMPPLMLESFIIVMHQLMLESSLIMTLQSTHKQFCCKMWVSTKLPTKENRSACNTSNQINRYPSNSPSLPSTRFPFNTCPCILIKQCIWHGRRLSSPSSAMQNNKMSVYSTQLNLCSKICAVRKYPAKLHSIFHISNNPATWICRENYFRVILRQLRKGSNRSWR